MRGKPLQNWIELPPSINMTLINEQGCLRIFSKRLDDICLAIFTVVAIVFLVQVVVVNNGYDEQWKSPTIFSFIDCDINRNDSVNKQSDDNEAYVK